MNPDQAGYRVDRGQSVPYPPQSGLRGLPSVGPIPSQGGTRGPRPHRNVQRGSNTAPVSRPARERPGPADRPGGLSDGGPLPAMLDAEEPREPRSGRQPAGRPDRPEGEGRPLQALRRRRAHGCPPLLGGVHAIRFDPRAPTTLLLGNGGGSSPETVHRAGSERAGGDPAGAGATECRSSQQRGEESECLPHVCKSLRLRLCQRHPPGEAGGGSGRLAHLPTVPRGKGDREDLSGAEPRWVPHQDGTRVGDRKSTRLNSSHQIISYAVFCLKKKKTQKSTRTRSTLTSSPTASATRSPHCARTTRSRRICNGQQRRSCEIYEQRLKRMLMMST